MGVVLTIPHLFHHAISNHQVCKCSTPSESCSAQICPCSDSPTQRKSCGACGKAGSDWWDYWWIALICTCEGWWIGTMVPQETTIFHGLLPGRSMHGYSLKKHQPVQCLYKSEGTRDQRRCMPICIIYYTILIYSPMWKAVQWNSKKWKLIVVISTTNCLKRIRTNSLRNSKASKRPLWSFAAILHAPVSKMSLTLFETWNCWYDYNFPVHQPNSPCIASSLA